MLYLKYLSVPISLDPHSEQRVLSEPEQQRLKTIFDDRFTPTKGNDDFLLCLVKKLLLFGCDISEKEVGLMGSSSSYILGYRPLEDVSDYDFFIPLHQPQSNEIVETICRALYETLYYIENNTESTLTKDHLVGFDYRIHLKQYYRCYSSVVENDDLGLSFVLFKGLGKLELKFTFNTPLSFMFGDEAVVIKDVVSPQPVLHSFYGTTDLPSFLMKHKLKVCITDIDNSVHGYYRLKWHNDFKKLPHQTTQFQQQWALSFKEETVLFKEGEPLPSPYIKLFSVLRNGYDHSYSSGKKQAKQFLYDFSTLSDFDTLSLEQPSDHSTYLRKLYSTLVTLERFADSSKKIPSRSWNIESSPLLEWTTIFTFFGLDTMSENTSHGYVQPMFDVLAVLHELSELDQKKLLMSMVSDWKLHSLNQKNDVLHDLSAENLTNKLVILLTNYALTQAPPHTTQEESLLHIPTYHNPFPIEVLDPMLAYLKAGIDALTHLKKPSELLKQKSSELITNHLLMAIGSQDIFALETEKNLNEVCKHADIISALVMRYVTKDSKSHVIGLFEFLIWSQVELNSTIESKSPSKHSVKYYKDLFLDHFTHFIPKSESEFLFLLECATSGLELFRQDATLCSSISAQIYSVPINRIDDKNDLYLFLFSYVSFLLFSEKTNPMFSIRVDSVFDRIKEQNDIDYYDFLLKYPTVWKELSVLSDTSSVRNDISSAFTRVSYSKDDNFTEDTFIALVFKWITSNSIESFNQNLQTLLVGIKGALYSDELHPFIAAGMYNVFDIIDLSFQNGNSILSENIKNSYQDMIYFTLSHLNLISKHDRDNKYENVVQLIYYIQAPLSYGHTKLLLSSIHIEFSKKHKKNKPLYLELTKHNSTLYYSLYSGILSALDSIEHTPSLDKLHRIDKVRKYFLSNVDLDTVNENLSKKSSVYFEHWINAIQQCSEVKTKSAELTSFISELLLSSELNYLYIPAFNIIKPEGFDIEKISSVVGMKNKNDLKKIVTEEFLLNAFSQFTNQGSFISSIKQTHCLSTVLNLRSNHTFIVSNKHIPDLVNTGVSLLEKEFEDLKIEISSEKVTSVISSVEQLRNTIDRLHETRSFLEAESQVLRTYQSKLMAISTATVDMLFGIQPDVSDEGSIKSNDILRFLCSYNVSKDFQHYRRIKEWLFSSITPDQYNSLNSMQFELFLTLYSEFYNRLDKDVQGDVKHSISEFVEGEKEFLEHTQYRLLDFDSYWDSSTASGVHNILFSYIRYSIVHHLLPLPTFNKTFSGPFKNVLLRIIQSMNTSTSDGMDPYMRILIYLSERISDGRVFPPLLNKQVYEKCAHKFYEMLPSIIQTHPVSTPFLDLQTKLSLCISATQSLFSIPRQTIDLIREKTGIVLESKIQQTLKKDALTIDEITVTLENIKYLDQYGKSLEHEEKLRLYEHITRLTEPLSSVLIEFKLQFECEEGRLLELSKQKVTPISFEVDMTFLPQKFWPSKL